MKSRSCSPVEVDPPLRIPLADWADRQLSEFARATGTRVSPDIGGRQLLGERASINGFRIAGHVSAGGGCRFYQTIDSHIALNLSRPEDRDMLPALFQEAGKYDDALIARSMATARAGDLVTQGRTLGLAIAHIDEQCPAPALRAGQTGLPSEHAAASPLVIDLSGLWAGPLAGMLLAHAGYRVIKVEDRNRPDSLRNGDPLLFARLNGGKDSVVLDTKSAADRDALVSLIMRARVVIEAARPRALFQLGIDADELVRTVPGLVWMTITAHGGTGDAAHWVGFGDDCAVAGGLSAALFAATGKIGFVGDAIADPLTGIFAARHIAEAVNSGTARRLFVAMSGVARHALDDQAAGGEAFSCLLADWAEAEGQPFPRTLNRVAKAPPRFGSDTRKWLQPC